MLHGTRPEGRRPNRAGATTAATPGPPAPAHLDALAAAYWALEAPDLAAAGRLAPRYLGQFEMLCSEYSLWRRATAGIPKRIRGKAFPPAVAIAGRARAAYMALALRFGLDPASDARLSELGGGPPAGDAPVPEPESRDVAWHRKHSGAQAT